MEELPVILMSAHASDEDIVKGLNQQANDYFIKPFSLGMMLSRVRTHVALKQMADERRKIFNALQRANDMKNNLMRIASHDLRDPINTMTMVHEMLRRYIPDDDDGEVADLFDIAQRVTNNMNNIINEFLNSDILSGDEIKVQLHPVSLVDVLSGILVDFKQTLDSKDLQVRLDVPTTTVIADERRLRQVLTNLVSNAIKYTPPSSSITVTSQLDAETENCTLHIIDEGKGIPPAEMHRLFQPFGKLSTQPTAGEQSTGLGLWIVKQMVEAQRGEVGLNTTYTGGADFWIRLPAVTEPLATAP